MSHRTNFGTWTWYLKQANFLWLFQLDDEPNLYIKKMVVSPKCLEFQDLSSEVGTWQFFLFRKREFGAGNVEGRTFIGIFNRFC